MLTVRQEGDKVILDLGGRRRDVLLTPLAAADLAEALEAAADAAARAPAELYRGERWACHVTSFDRRVALRLAGPGFGLPGRVPLPPAAARRLADLLRTNANMAGFGMRITVGKG
jgi:hypothetical protein